MLQGKKPQVEKHRSKTSGRVPDTCDNSIVLFNVWGSVSLRSLEKQATHTLIETSSPFSDIILINVYELPTQDKIPPCVPSDSLSKWVRNGVCRPVELRNTDLPGIVTAMWNIFHHFNSLQHIWKWQLKSPFEVGHQLDVRFFISMKRLCGGL